MDTVLSLRRPQQSGRTARDRARVRLAPTRRGRRLVVLLAFLLGLAVATVSMLALDVSSALAGGSDHAVTVTVESGDTLWGYAEEYAPAQDPYDFVQRAQQLNDLPTQRLTAGSTITLPTGEIDR